MILLRVAIFFLLMLLLPDWYIHRVYIRCKKNKLYSRLLWWPTIGLLLLLAIFIALHDILHDYFGIYLIVTLCFCIPKLTFVLFSLILRGINKISGLKIPHATISTLPALAMLGYILFGAIKGKENFKVREVTFTSANLPEEFDGYRVMQLSDIHSGSWKGNPEALKKAIDLCNRQNADLALFTGDLVNSRSDELLEFTEIFSELKAKDGVYSVLGNHDYGTYVKWNSEADRIANIDSLIARENRMGWRMLNNSHTIIRRGNDSIAVIGVENSGRPPFPDYARLKEASAGTEGMFQILMSHDPTHWRRQILPESDIELTLSGHTHDMQITFFGLSVSSFIYPEHNGMYMEGERGLYVNIGLGHVLFPMRLGAWPEITVITLKKK
ncbi:metallophosphoesterase [Bacteroides sp. ET336]|uniref:metallophosphoesterase n=1 Tax=Bacteroides sp. ET336 TaxID=2972459 RepID=UPI0021AC21CC|nr:metallophosphoesterase [Bacteroides sp. ET336]MCR8893539.1 metallophosphoesterase [Bacteroides sp. ET336]MDN0058036.1 metallophosphoesterase [Bacteroides caecigallinarum]